MAGVREGVELPGVDILRQRCREELAARLDSVRMISYFIEFMLW